MYGITNPSGAILCRRSHDTYVFKQWERNGNFIAMDSAFEVDELLQQIMTASGNYNLSVFEYTEEQEEYLIMRKLRGY